MMTVQKFKTFRVTLPAFLPILDRTGLLWSGKTLS